MLCMGRHAVYGETSCMGRQAVWGDKLYGETCCVWGDILYTGRPLDAKPTLSLRLLFPLLQRKEGLAPSRHPSPPPSPARPATPRTPGTPAAPITVAPGTAHDHYVDHYADDDAPPAMVRLPALLPPGDDTGAMGDTCDMGAIGDMGDMGAMGAMGGRR